MFSQTSYEDFFTLIKQPGKVFIQQQFLEENSPSINGFKALIDSCNESSLIETYSAEGKLQTSFIGINPHIKFIVHEDQAIIFEENKPECFLNGNPFDELKIHFEKNKPLYKDLDNPFFGNQVGFFSYDAIRFFEDIPDQHALSSSSFPKICFHLYRTMIIYEHSKRILTLLELAEKGIEPKKSYCDALERMKEHRQMLNNSASIPISGGNSLKPESDFDDREFADRISIAKEYLRQGNIFQVVLSRTFAKKTSVDPISIYQNLKTINPSPYMFLLNFEGYSIVGASPEKLVTVLDGNVETIPIAGTCPRHHNDTDFILEEDLLADPKENAEHMMLVDLARNDLGIVSIPGTVKVTRLKDLQRLSHVTHMISTVQGKLSSGLSALDAIKATFPAGTLSGAPKIRAMEIIDELEISRRGLYGGAICTFDTKGNMESFLAIRTAVIKKGELMVRVGAGIVLDSDPQKEADETRHKAKGILEAIRRAEEGLLC